MSALDLCSSFGDVLRPPRAITLPQQTDASIHVYSCDAGSVSSLFPGIRDWFGRHLYEGVVVGAAAEFSAAQAKFKAACEAAERYSSSVLLPDEWRVATYDELGTDALDWQALPRLNEQEASAPGQLFNAFSPADPIRWIPGLHVSSGQKKWVPAALTHVFPRPWSTERFTVPISTGTAVHSDEVLGVVACLNEVIERDAISLTWLLRRPVARITFDSGVLKSLPLAVSDLVTSPEFRLYDATTDVGMPTVYARRIQRGNARVTNVVGCATAFDYGTALAKALTEVVMISRSLEQGQFDPKDQIMDCEAIHDGAVFMARAEYSHAFDFLDDNGEVALSDLVLREPLKAGASTSERALWLFRRVTELAMDIYVVNLTSDELRDVGVGCYRVVVPQLMPLSLVQRARFLGTPRLALMAAKENLLRRLPEDVNPYPQPFA